MYTWTGELKEDLRIWFESWLGWEGFIKRLAQIPLKFPRGKIYRFPSLATDSLDNLDTDLLLLFVVTEEHLGLSFLWLFTCVTIIGKLRDLNPECILGSYHFLFSLASCAPIFNYHQLWLEGIGRIVELSWTQEKIVKHKRFVGK
jgi:hypothetical protein